MKPILLLNSGTAFSGTSPLHFTLCMTNKYAHTGLCKEDFYLFSLQEGIEIPFKPDTTGKKPTELTIHHGKEILDGERSIDKYISYYKSLSEHLTDYKAVADFSNQNACLTEEFMLSIRDKLLEVFDIRVIMVFRDPVRRLFSVANRNAPTDPQDYIKRMCVGKLEPNAYYSDIYTRHCNVWGEEKVHPIIMEEFWAGDTRPLAEFLEFPFTKIHPNVYYPDMGSRAPHYPYLMDQWSSDVEDLDLATQMFVLEHMDHVYSDFAKTFGRIPEVWMK